MEDVPKILGHVFKICLLASKMQKTKRLFAFVEDKTFFLIRKFQPKNTSWKGKYPKL